MAKNTFYAATMGFATISTYYPNNLNFGCFVFQQMLDDATAANNDYMLNAYAVATDGTVMNGGNPLALITSLLNPLQAKGKRLNFANFKLNKTELGILYKDATSDLTVIPTSFYKKTGYTVYTAQTTVTVSLDVFINIDVTLNPSPPA